MDCNICVQVCPTGIDIRDGLQYQCIGCAACIDGCDQVMDKMGYPRGLIRYSTQHAVEQKLTCTQMLARAFRPRVLVYTAILWAVIIAAAVGLWVRVPLKVDVIRDRAAIAREVEGGKIENVYRLQIMNTAETRRELRDRRRGPAVAPRGGRIARRAGTDLEPDGAGAGARASRRAPHAGHAHDRVPVTRRETPRVWRCARSPSSS